MSAVSEKPEKARLSYTSPATLMTAVVLSIVLLAFSLYGWWAIGTEIRNRVTWPQAATLLFFVLLMIGIMLSVGYSRLWADGDEVVIRNGPVLRRFPVSQIAGVRMRPGDAWASLLIKSDGVLNRKATLAIQSLEGEQAQRKVKELRRWLVAHGATSEGFTSDDRD